MPSKGIIHYFAYLEVKTANHTARHHSMKQNKLIITYRFALRQTLSPPAHSVRTPKNH